MGAPLDDTGGGNKGALYLLNMNADGTVKAHQKVAEGTAGFNTTLAHGARFGSAITTIGDVDEDGVDDLADGAPWAASVTGAVYTLFLNATSGPDGTQEVSMNVGDLAATWYLGDSFGATLTSLGHVDGNVVRLAGQWVDRRRPGRRGRRADPDRQRFA